MYKIFRQLCQIRNVTPYQVAKDTGVSQSTLSNWKSRDNILAKNNAEKIAKYFGVTVPYLEGEVSWIECPLCHLHLDPANISDVAEHEAYHNRFLELKKKYGDLIDLVDVYGKRDRAIDMFRDKTLSVEERVSAFDEYLRYDYMRYLVSNKLKANISYQAHCSNEVASLVPDGSVSISLINRIRRAHGMPNIANNGYYVDDESAQIAQDIFDNQNLRLLFDAARTASEEDIQTTYAMLMALKRKEEHEDDLP